MARGGTIRRGAGGKPQRVATPKAGAEEAGEWTPGKQADFLLELTLSANVTQSARKVGLSEKQAYKRRTRYPAFKRAWEAALVEGYARLELVLLERVLTDVPRSAAPDEDKAATAAMRGYPDRLALQLLAQHRTTVERVRAAEARTGANRAAGDAARQRARLIERLDRIAQRLEGGEG